MRTIAALLVLVACVTAVPTPHRSYGGGYGGYRGYSGYGGVYGGVYGGGYDGLYGGRYGGYRGYSGYGGYRGYSGYGGYRGYSGYGGRYGGNRGYSGYGGLILAEEPVIPLASGVVDVRGYVDSYFPGSSYEGYGTYGPAYGGRGYPLEVYGLAPNNKYVGIVGEYGGLRGLSGGYVF